GLTLTDCSAAMFVAGLLFGAMAIPLQTQFENRKIEVTEQRLENARQALLGYAAAHGYFPCPADNGSSGQEPSASDHATGSCPAYHGFLPAAALGFTFSDGQGYAVDAWSRPENRIRYAVSNQTLGAVTNTNAL